MPSKPMMVLNFDDPLVNKLSLFIKFINEHCAFESNLDITIKVLECLMYIKLNEPLLKYAIENKNDRTIYTYTADIEKQVLRAHNDLSFHIISYDNAERAIADYQGIIQSVEKGIDSFNHDLNLIKIFIRKIKNSKIGCMEERLSEALLFAVEPDILDLNDIFSEFNTQVYQHINEVSKAQAIEKIYNFFIDKINLPIKFQGAYIDLHWNIILQYLKETLVYEEINPKEIFSKALIKHVEGMYEVYFATEERALSYLRTIQMTLDSDFYIELQLARVKAVKLNPITCYQFKLTEVQFLNLLHNTEKQLEDITIVPSITTLTNKFNTNISELEPELLCSFIRQYPALIDFPLNNLGSQCIHLTLFRQKFELLKILIREFNIDINLARPDGVTPLSIAIEYCEDEVVKFILTQPNIDIHCQTIKGVNALIKAVCHSPSKVELLLNHSQNSYFNFDALSFESKKTALALAKQKNLDSIVAIIEAAQTHQYDYLQNEIKNRNETAAFVSYCNDSRKVPITSLMHQWLNRDISQPMNNDTLQIKARKVWTEVVSATFNENATYLKRFNIRQTAINRLKKLNISNPEQTFNQCLDYLKYYTIPVVTFNGSFLKNGLTDFQLLNFREKNNKSDQYFKKREKHEQTLFDFLDGTLKTDFISNPHARPRFGTIALTDKQSLIKPAPWYGQSYVVLKPIVKLNSLFVGGGSLDHFAAKKECYHPCTVHNLEFILWQCPLATLKSIINRVTKGVFTANFNPVEFSEASGGYLEILLPAVNIFDPNLVERIVIDPSEYSLSEKEINHFKALGITIITKAGNIYEGCKEFNNALLENNVANVKQWLNSFPSLASLPNAEGKLPIEIAVENNGVEVLKLFEAMGFEFDRAYLKRDRLLSIAVEYGCLEATIFILDILVKRTGRTHTDFINEPINNESLLHLACVKNHRAIVSYLLSKGANINAVGHNSWTALHISVTQSRDLAQLLIDNNADLTLKNNENLRADQIKIKSNYIKEMRKEFITAIQKDDIETVKSQLSKNTSWLILPLNKLKFSAFQYAVHHNKVAILLELVQFYPVNIQWTSPFGKTALSRGIENGRLDLVKAVVNRYYPLIFSEKSLQIVESAFKLAHSTSDASIILKVTKLYLDFYLQKLSAYSKPSIFDTSLLKTTQELKCAVDNNRLTKELLRSFPKQIYKGKFKLIVEGLKPMVQKEVIQSFHQ